MCTPLPTLTQLLLHLTRTFNILCIPLYLLCIYCTSFLFFFFFFFQAEDGIRDLIVTGVQTCALPISFSKNKLSMPSFTLLHYADIALILKTPSWSSDKPPVPALRGLSYFRAR